MRLVAPGAAVSVEVPATSANLGPGFDCLGLALDWRERLELEVVGEGVRIDVTGEGAESLPRDETHLVVRALQRGLGELGLRVPGLALRAHNTIPHGRGLGSSSAAIVAGLVAARALAGIAPDEAWLTSLATQIEGHPDNVAAAVHGGLVLAYEREDGVVAVPGDLHPEVRAAVVVATTSVATTTARGLLPREVPHADAAANAGRAALLVHALAREPGLLLDATADRLHQHYRAPAMPEAYGLVTRLRGAGFPAVISGAGPTVLVLGTPSQLAGLEEHVPDGLVRRVGIGTGASAVRREQ